MRNLGRTSLRKRRRSSNPMREYDALPTPLRIWLSEAALPWSPKSAHRIWMRARKRGDDTATILETLARSEAKTLARDKFTTVKYIEYDS